MKARVWDLFCRVVDNFGDLGVCWRLAADLAERGQSVRLWVDDPAALAWMAPGGSPHVSLLHWTAAAPDLEPGDVVIEAFGCDPPTGFVQRMASRRAAPLWLNLEYLSAEAYVERSHRLPSPQSAGPGAGLTKWFFYPGFTPATGGLLRERGLLERRQAFDSVAWLATLGLQRRADDERLISLFCYPQPGLETLLDAASERPTLLLATAGQAAQQVRARLGAKLRRGELRCVIVPPLTQLDFDRLLWSCDLNFVRGEDSFVRAQWAGAPFVWQIYPQQGGVHGIKLQAFLDRFLARADAALSADVRATWRHWNGLAAAPPHWPAHEAWQRLSIAWRGSLAAQADLGSQLIDFVNESG
jgi:uncharacterized repeat protein (TIGR03837 family)